MEQEAIMEFIKSMIQQNKGNDYDTLQKNLEKFRQYLEETHLAEETVMNDVRMLQKKMQHYSQVSAQIKEINQDPWVEEDLHSVLTEVDQKLIDNLINAIPNKTKSQTKEDLSSRKERTYVKMNEEPMMTYRPVERREVSSSCSGGYSHTSGSC